MPPNPFNHNSGLLRILILVTLIAIQIGVIYLLLTASEWLFYPLSKEPYWPLGNALTWVGLIAYPLMFWLARPRGFLKFSFARQAFRFLVLTALCMGLTWGAVSFLLAGNWNYSFHGGWQPKAWKAFTAAIVALPALGVLILFLDRLIRLVRFYFFRKG